MLGFIKKFRALAVVGIAAITIATFGYFFATHPAIRTQLHHTPVGLLVVLLLLYGISMLAVGLILVATLVLCRTTLPLREGTLLVMYSTIVNFFGPLQSGPAVRAVYLKKRHGLKLRDYTSASLVYYAFYGVYSVVLLFSSVLKWWLIPGVLVAALLCLQVARSNRPYAERFHRLNLRGLGLLASATLLQMILTTIIYYIELHSVSPHIHLAQVITYTGAANLALFVSITPGAIGFRESFLVFSERLHHVSGNVIVSANIIDRSVYVVLLVLLLLVITATHAGARFRSLATTRD